MNDRHPETRPSVATIASEARAKRARDHLARKRLQERTRLQRVRGRAATAGSRARTRGLLPPVLFFFAFGAGLFFASSLTELLLYRGLPLQQIAVQGSSSLTPKAIVQSLELEAGRSLDSIGPEELRNAIKREPWIESLRSLRLPSGTLIISVVEREAIARWRTDPTSVLALIDHHGERFAARIGPGGPLPLVLGKASGGPRLPTSAIKILAEIRRHVVLAGDANALTLHLPGQQRSDPELMQGDTATIDADADAGYILQIGDRGPRVLLGSNFLEQRIARLAVLLESEEPLVGNSRQIDLRYADRAVLRSEPASG